MNRTLLFVFALWITTPALAETQRIIDVHRHAAWPHTGDKNQYRRDVIQDMDRNNVAIAVLSITFPEQIERWVERYPGRFLAGPMLPCPRNSGVPAFHCFPDTDGMPALDWLEQNIKAGHISVMHEMMFNYDGSSPASEKVMPYWALAEEYGVRVGVHTGTGPPAGQGIRRDPQCCLQYDGEMGNPALLRPVLERHPELRIWLQHVGSDGEGPPGYWAETLALLADYPNVYVDLSITNSILPLDEYEAALSRLIDAGFEGRIMFGSDNVPVDAILERLDAIDWLSQPQRSAILHDNAARFFGLSNDSSRP